MTIRNKLISLHNLQENEYFFNVDPVEYNGYVFLPGTKFWVISIKIREEPGWRDPGQIKITKFLVSQLEASMIIDNSAVFRRIYKDE